MTEKVIIDEEINKGLQQLIDAQLKHGAINDDLFFEVLIELKDTDTPKTLDVLKKYNQLVDCKNKKAECLVHKHSNMYILGRVLTKCSPFIVEQISGTVKNSKRYKITANITDYKQTLPDFMNNIYLDATNSMAQFFEKYKNEQNSCYSDPIKTFLEGLNNSFEVEHKTKKNVRGTYKAIISKTNFFKTVGFNLSEYGQHIDELFSILVNNKIISYDGKSYSIHSKQHSLLNGLLNYVPNNTLTGQSVYVGACGLKTQSVC